MMSEGYCYLVWLEALFKGYELRRECALMANNLGSWPRTNLVLGYMLGKFDMCGCRFEVPCGQPGYLHVVRGRPKVKFEELLLLLTPVLRYRIGGDAFNISSGEFLKMLNVEPKQLLTNIYSDNRNQLINQVAQSVTIDILRTTTSREKHKRNVRIPYNLTPKEEAALIACFPEFKIEVTGMSRHEHAYAAASRICESEFLLLMVGFGGDMSPNSVYHKAVVDIGGNFWDHFIRGRTTVHSCCPILDIRDETRMVNKLHNLRVMHNIKTSQMNVIEEHCTRNRIFCFNKSQDCKITAPALMFLHSIYDMTNTDIADCMDSHNADIAFGSFIFDPVILYRKKGIIGENLNCEFNITHFNVGKMDLEKTNYPLLKKEFQLITASLAPDGMAVVSVWSNV